MRQIPLFFTPNPTGEYTAALQALEVLPRHIPGYADDSPRLRDASMRIRLDSAAARCTSPDDASLSSRRTVSCMTPAATAYNRITYLLRVDYQLFSDVPLQSLFVITFSALHDTGF